MTRLETDFEVEQTARATEEREFDTIEAYLTQRKAPLRNEWAGLTKQMHATRAGGFQWLTLNKLRDEVLAVYAIQFFVGNQRLAVLDLIEGVK